MGEKMKDFKKEVYIGRLKDDHRYHVFVEIEYNNKGLSITGEETTKNKKYFRSRGQITLDPNEIEFAPGWNKEKVERLENIWNKWHLNDMRAGCEHQRKNWDLGKEIEIVYFTWSQKFNDMRKRAEDGLMNEQEYSEYKQLVPDIFKTTITTSKQQWMSPIAQELLSKKLIQIRDKKTEKASWIRIEEHPEGLLCKPCEICGYKYGTEWLHEDVPEEILQELMEM